MNTKKLDVFSLMLFLILQKIKSNPDSINNHPLYLTFLKSKTPLLNIPKFIANSDDGNPFASIVIQYQFEDLVIFRDFFSIKLYFGQNLEKLCIPYSSIVSFELYNYMSASKPEDSFEMANNVATMFEVDFDQNVEDTNGESCTKNYGRVINFDDIKD